MAQQTAVEWLYERLQTEPYLTLQDFQQAKQMEREQIEKAWDDGFDTGYLSPNNAEKYYNEIYGK